MEICMYKKYVFYLMLLFCYNIKASLAVRSMDEQNRWVVPFDSQMTFFDLKKEIQKASGIPAEQQELLYGGRLIFFKDNESVEPFKLEHANHIKVRVVAARAAKAPVIKASDDLTKIGKA